MPCTTIFHAFPEWYAGFSELRRAPIAGAKLLELLMGEPKVAEARRPWGSSQNIASCIQEQLNECGRLGGGYILAEERRHILKTRGVWD